MKLLNDSVILLMQYSRTVSQTKHFHSYATRNEVNTSCKVKCSCNRTASYNYSKIVCIYNRRRVIILKDCNRKDCGSLVAGFKTRSARHSREKLHAQAISSMFSFLFAGELFVIFKIPIDNTFPCSTLQETMKTMI